MNKYVDERLIKYKRPQMTAKTYNSVKKGRPLARNTKKEGIFLRSLKIAAEIFLLIISTLSGEDVSGQKGSTERVEKTLKLCLIYTGVFLALWGILVVISNIANAVTLLPIWMLIPAFAAIVLCAAGVFKN